MATDSTSPWVNHLPPPQSTESFWHTQPSPLLTGHRSTRELPARADIVIVGSGITGASVAHHLLDPDASADAASTADLDVVLLEAREVCWGATGRNGGHCLPVAWEFPHDPSIGRFETDNFNAIHDCIQRFDIPCEFVAQPGVRGLYTDQHLSTVSSALAQLQKTSPDLASHLRIVVDPSELAELRLPTAKGAIVTDLAARLWPYKFVAAIFERLLSAPRLKAGGKFNLQALTPVVAIRRSEDNDGDLKWHVITPRGSVSATRVVLATNAYTSHLLPAFESLIVPCRGQMSALHPPTCSAGECRLTSSYGFLGDGLDDYLIQRSNETGGHLMFGGGRQMGPSMNTVDDSILDANVAKYLRKRLVSAMGLTPDAEHEELIAEKEWTGIMGFSRDDVPWVGEVPWSLLSNGDTIIADESANSNLFLAAGYTGHGMPNAWLCGRALAALAGDEASIDAVKKQTGLPDAYMITDERVTRAQMLNSVAARDWAEMARGREA